MGFILEKNLTMLSLLEELVRCDILTPDEMDRIKIEFKEAEVVFKILTLEQRKLFIEELDEQICKDVAECDIVHFQDVHNLVSGDAALVKTWCRIQDYAFKHNCPIVAIVHALMVKHAKL